MRGTKPHASSGIAYTVNIKTLSGCKINKETASERRKIRVTGRNQFKGGNIGNRYIYKLERRHGERVLESGQKLQRAVATSSCCGCCGGRTALMVQIFSPAASNSERQTPAARRRRGTLACRAVMRWRTGSWRPPRSARAAGRPSQHQIALLLGVAATACWARRVYARSAAPPACPPVEVPATRRAEIFASSTVAQRSRCATSLAFSSPGQP